MNKKTLVELIIFGLIFGVIILVNLYRLLQKFGKRGLGSDSPRPSATKGLRNMMFNELKKQFGEHAEDIFKQPRQARPQTHQESEIKIYDQFGNIINDVEQSTAFLTEEPIKDKPRQKPSPRPTPVKPSPVTMPSPDNNDQLRAYHQILSNNKQAAIILNEIISKPLAFRD